MSFGKKKTTPATLLGLISHLLKNKDKEDSINKSYYICYVQVNIFTDGAVYRYGPLARNLELSNLLSCLRDPMTSHGFISAFLTFGP